MPPPRMPFVLAAAPVPPVQTGGCSALFPPGARNQCPPGGNRMTAPPVFSHGAGRGPGGTLAAVGRGAPALRATRGAAPRLRPQPRPVAPSDRVGRPGRGPGGAVARATLLPRLSRRRSPAWLLKIVRNASYTWLESH